MFSCRCLNVSVTIDSEGFSIADVVTLPRTSPVSVEASAGRGIATLGENVDGKSRELSNFFLEAVGPVADAIVTVQLKTLLKTISSDGWEVGKCLNCSCLVFARDPLQNPTPLLVNSSLRTTPEAIAQRKAQENYSPAYRIMLDGRSADFRGFYRKDEHRSLFNAAANTLDSTNDSNELLVQLRAFMRAETQLANERIARITQELNEQLCNMRDRAEQDYLFLAQTFVPEQQVDNKSSEAVAAAAGIGMPTLVRSTSGGHRRMEVQGCDEKGNAGAADGGGGGPVLAKTLAQLMNNVSTAGSDTVAGPPQGSQMETPPPTPECMPMSTGNSPPSMVQGGANSSTETSAMATGGSVKQPLEQRQPQNSSRASSISSNSFASDGQEAGGLRSQSTNTMRSALSSSLANTINNNNNSTMNRGAINKPPTQQQQQQQQHSISTNLFANHNTSALTASPGMSANVGASLMSKFSSTGGGNNHAFDSDCLFDIDGMENDKTPPPDSYSDEEECVYDDSTDNNNQEGGMHIPSLPYRQNSSIARSLPISTPKPITPFRGNDDDLDEMTEEAVDIPASIKAIAKSVHGDAVFGDLPRRQIQKFTSQI